MTIFTELLMVLITQGGTMTALPAPDYTNISLEECIENRRSKRSFQDEALTLEQTSLILWAAQGITDETRSFRAAPSAGATYPLEIYTCAHNGVYKYIPEGHGMEQIIIDDVRTKIAHAALDQMFIADAGMIVVITAIYERTTWRYGERGVRYVHMEVGHVAQNIHLQAVALGLGSVPVGAFHENTITDILQLEEEIPLYIIPVGYPKK